MQIKLEAVIASLTVGTLERLDAGMSISEVVEWVHLCAARSTNHAPTVISRYLTHFIAHLDLFNPLSRRQRGEMVASIAGLLYGAKWS